MIQCDPEIVKTLEENDYPYALDWLDRKNHDPRLVCHVGYTFPHAFLWAYARESYRLLPFKPFHISMLTAIRPGEYGKNVNLQAPRGIGKTTLMSVLYPVYRICYRHFDLAMGRLPEEFILLVGRNEKFARLRMTEIRGIFERNRSIRRAFGNMVNTKDWTKTAMKTANGVTVRPLGRGSSPRGALDEDVRPTLKVVDDAEDPKRVLNPDLRDEDWEWVQTDLQFVSDISDERSNTIWVDTSKHADSISERLRDTPGWTSLRFQACQFPITLYHPSCEDTLWKSWGEIYTDMTLENDEREAKADAFYAAHEKEMTDGVKLLWPESLTYLKIRKLIAERGYAECLRELQNIPRDPSNALFDMERAGTFSIEKDGLNRSDGRKVLWRDLAGFTTYVDTAGGRDSHENSFAVAVAVAFEPLPGGSRDNPDSLAGTNAYVMGCWMDRVPLSRQMAEAIDLHMNVERLMIESRPHTRFVVEKRPDPEGTIQFATSSAFKDASDKAGFDGRIEFHASMQNKVERIAVIEPYIANKWLCFAEKGLPTEFWKQFSEFPSADHDDAPDAVTGACSCRIKENRTMRDYRRAKNKSYRPQIHI